MKFAFFFVCVAFIVFSYRTLLKKQERQKAIRNTAAWIVPLLVASATTITLILFSLYFNGKVI